jgi:predicted component of type VI protein secretion system
MSTRYELEVLFAKLQEEVSLGNQESALEYLKQLDEQIKSFLDSKLSHEDVRSLNVVFRDLTRLTDKVESDKESVRQQVLNLNGAKKLINAYNSVKYK